MSALYGTLQGSRGEATRCGTKSSGMRVSCQSWETSVITEMDYDQEDKLRIEIRIADGSSSGWGAQTFFRGTGAELKEALTDYMNKRRNEALQRTKDSIGGEI